MTTTLVRTRTRSLTACEELATLGWEINANQYRAVHLAARYEEEQDWFRAGLRSAAAGISDELQIHASTAREWIRVGHSLRHLPLIDAAFKANEISYAKTRILTRWADDDNEQQLLDLARSRTAGRLTAAIARAVAASETDEDRDQRHHWNRSFTTYTDGDGMIIVRMALAPAIAKPVLAAVDEVVRQIAQTPADPSPALSRSECSFGATGDADASAGACEQRIVSTDSTSTTSREVDASAGASEQRCVNTDPGPTTDSKAGAPADASSSCAALSSLLPRTLRELRDRWQPEVDDDWVFPTVAQQRADAFAALFLGLDIQLTTEVVIHIRGDGNTFDDGTPVTTNAIARQLHGGSCDARNNNYFRLMIHDGNRRPLDASNRRRYPTTRQARVVLEAHNHECVNCQSTDLIELDHNPPFEQTRHTITTELQPRCAPCHRARHRFDISRGPGHPGPIPATSGSSLWNRPTPTSRPPST